MYKTAIAHIEGEASYDEALNSFRVAYPEYEVRGVKQSNDGWLAFLQKNAFEDESELPNPEDVEVSEEEFSPGADEDMTEYEAEEEKQEGLMGRLEEALDKVEQLVAEIKESEETEEEAEGHEEYHPEDEMGGLDLEREKEDGLTLASATAEVEELLSTDPTFSGYRIASVSETEASYIAKLKKS